MRIYGIFKTSCPTEWTRQSSWDGRFLRGGGAYSLQEGSPAAHTHTGSGLNLYSDVEASVINRKMCTTGAATPVTLLSLSHIHTIDIIPFTSGSTTYTPPYVTVVFCYRDV